MKNIKKISALGLIITLFSLTSCVETAIIGSAATATVVLREKSLENTGQDVLIVSKIEAQFVKSGLKNPGNSVDVTVNEGRVLLTGVIRNTEKARVASQLAWKVEGVKEVIDEIQIENQSLRPRDFPMAFNDYFLTLRAETSLLFTHQVSAVNYKITTVRGVVYLIGVAQNDSEMKTVLDKISKIRGVKRIVNYVILADDARRR